MEKKVEILGVIPARGGSRGIPRKNLVPLGGKPLLAYTCKAALASHKLSRVVLNSDAPEIAKVAAELGIEVPFLRPAQLARDDTPIIDVLVHMTQELKESGYWFDYLVLLQPTSPLRTETHIDQAIELALARDADTVVSVVAVPHQFTPHSLMQLQDGLLVPYHQGPMILRRQDKPRLYARNGPALLVVRRQVIEGGQLYGKSVYHFEMSMADSVDIDDPTDLALAEFYLQRRQSGEVPNSLQFS